MSLKRIRESKSGREVRRLLNEQSTKTSEKKELKEKKDNVEAKKSSKEKNLSNNKRLFSIVTNNIALKILAIIIAVIVWWIVMNIDDPLEKKTLSGIVVELRNTDTLTGKGYIYNVESGGVITITVRAPQSICKDLKSSDFVAYADLSELNPLTDSANIEIECVKSDLKTKVLDITAKTKVVKLSIDNKETADIPVIIELYGSPATDYVIGEYYASQTKIQVTGAATKVETISKAVVSYNVSDLTSSVSEKVSPIFYDENGNRVDVSEMELSRNTLNLSVEILPTKWVSVKAIPSGTVANGYKMTGYTTNIDQVKIAGTRANLANINSIAIPADTIVMDDIKESTDYYVTIANHLSGVYKIVSDVSELIVHVEVEPLITKSFIIDRERIVVNNLADTLEAKLVDENTVIYLSSIQQVLENFDLDALNASIDLKDKLPGEYNNIVLQMTTNDNFSVVGTYMISVVITPKPGYEYMYEQETKEETEQSTEKSTEKSTDKNTENIKNNTTDTKKK